MVMSGQFLERPTLIPVGKQVLEGLWHRGDRTPGCLVLSPAEGGMDHTVATELVWALSRAGHPTLRFNFRGVGASQGKRGELAARIEDARAALTLLRENTEGSDAVVFCLRGSEAVGLAVAALTQGVGLVDPETLTAKALRAARVPLWTLLSGENATPELEQRVLDAQGTLRVVQGADRAFRQQLPEVGRGAVEWLASLHP